MLLPSIEFLDYPMCSEMVWSLSDPGVDDPVVNRLLSTRTLYYTGCMPHSDAERWDARYREDVRFGSYRQPRCFLVENAHLLPTQGLALDVAMGQGGNAAYLIARGLRVVGVDISSVAVHQAKRRLPDLMAVIADLTRFYLPEARFDVILNFFYLQRELWGGYQQALRPGGLLILETLTVEMLSINPEIDRRYLLQPGELKAAFGNWQILVYREGWVALDTSHPRAVARLVARRPGE
jgi:SAM-dependent methyltransferase